MPSMSQIDMVALDAVAQTLQVCGNFEQLERTTPSREVAEFLVVVRQDDNVAKLQGTHTYGRWKFQVALGPQNQFEVGKPAVASAVVILKQEPAGLETISWIQPVKVEGLWQPEDESEHVKFNPNAVGPPKEGTFPTDPEPMHSISSSLAIFKDDSSGKTYGWRQKVQKVPRATHHSTW
jgi:hypothetical protein